MRNQFVGGLVLTISVGAALCAFAQTTGPQNPPLMIWSVAGKDLFEFYCASCHGRDGRGDGPAVAALKAAPPDLRLLARHNRGEFPRQRVEEFVTNGGNALVPAHGTTDMPVWGPVFRGLIPSDISVKVRIANIVQYLKSIRTK